MPPKRTPTLQQPLLSYGRQTSSLKDAIAMPQSEIVIDNAKRPAHLDFWNRGIRDVPPDGKGIIRKKGEVVEIIYLFFSNAPRPESFEQPPAGQYWLTLQRIG